MADTNSDSNTDSIDFSIDASGILDNPDISSGAEPTDGLLYHPQRLYVPEDEAVQSELFACFHKDPLAGYFGKKRILKLIQRHYYWVHIEKYINHKVSIWAGASLQIQDDTNPMAHYSRYQSQKALGRKSPWTPLL